MKKKLVLLKYFNKTECYQISKPTNENTKLNQITKRKIKPTAINNTRNKLQHPQKQIKTKLLYCKIQAL